MAKRRKSSGRKSYRRRRVSGVGRAGMMELAELAGGTVLGGMAGRMVATSLGQGKDPKIVGAMQMAVGYFIASKASGPIMKGLGVGMIANGGMDIAHSMGIIKGPGEGDLYLMDSGVSGDESDFISGDEGEYLSGDEEISGPGNQFIAGGNMC